MEAWVAWLMELFRSEHIEFALFAAAFISATVLPGGSEAVLAGAVAGTPSRVVEFVRQCIGRDDRLVHWALYSGAEKRREGIGMAS